ncbi:Ktr system potassium transporter B [Paenibacillus sambharensis]|uniref:Ktr system potassium transporter B n=1 Tax=Paenibacillus sambharensis TaxID=1803190 RepID=A0A2W1L9L3_9BACL|nr:TrkH family potassium uptake protein [Paenibacillus sambharensis]PZD95593.1 Ktr system potassium transporter B [Paenibacillus sambharensis]
MSSDTIIEKQKKQRKLLLTAPQIILFGFAFFIVLGAVLLDLPIASASGESVGFLDALFTSTSAVCVTGLVVFDTAGTFSLFGELVIMILIQIGGLGFMTFGVLFAVLIGKRIGLKERLLLQQSTGAISFQGVVRLSLGIFLTALIIEVIGAALLAVRWSQDMDWMRAIYFGVFHSISSFNNAGFGLWSDSLMRYVGDPLVNIVIVGLFVVGGIGFTVILDIYNKRKWRNLTLHTRIVLIMSLILSAAGFLFIYCVELFNPATFGALSRSEQLWAGFFQGLVPRTAGFNTLDIAAMMTASQFFMILLMFIGASSGSTGGGIKTNTFAVLMLTVWMIIRGKEDLHLLKRRIAHEIILRALAVIIISMAVVLTSTLLLSITEHTLQKDFLELLFEATSAFATVGMSMGLTPELSPAGKVIIIATMFIGRLGPLTLAFALTRNTKAVKYRYPEEKVLIG